MAALTVIALLAGFGRRALLATSDAVPTFNEAIHCGQRSLNAQTTTGSAAAYLVGRLREAQQAIAQTLSPARRIFEVMKKLGCQPPRRHGHDGKHLLSAGCLAQDGIKATTATTPLHFGDFSAQRCRF